MASHHLSNYLRKYRKRSALSQKEVAYLLGVQSAAKVCRYERFAREPGLETALAYEVIFQRPMSELFPVLYERMESEVRARAKKLGTKQPLGNNSLMAARKRESLAAIASGKTYKKPNYSEKP